MEVSPTGAIADCHLLLTFVPKLAQKVFITSYRPQSVSGQATFYPLISEKGGKGLGSAMVTINKEEAIHMLWDSSNRTNKQKLRGVEV